MMYAVIGLLVAAIIFIGYRVSHLKAEVVVKLKRRSRVNHDDLFYYVIYDKDFELSERSEYFQLKVEALNEIEKLREEYRVTIIDLAK